MRVRTSRIKRPPPSGVGGVLYPQSVPPAPPLQRRFLLRRFLTFRPGKPFSIHQVRLLTGRFPAKTYEVRGILEPVKTVSISAFRQALREGAAAFDTRTSARHQQDGLPGVAHLSLEEIQAGRLPDVPKEEAVYLVCERGQLSELAGLYLEAAGFSEVYNVAGGVLAWRQGERAKEIT